MTTVLSRIHINRKQFTTMVVFVLIAAILQMLAPGIVSLMINDGIGDSNKKLIIILAIAILVVSVMSCLFQIISSNIAADITAKFSADLREEVYHKAQTFSAAEMDKFGTSSMISRNTTDVTTIQNFVSMLLRVGFLAPLMMVAGLVLSIATAGKVSLVLAVAIPILIIGVTTLIVASSRYSVKLRDKIDEINQLFMETLEGVRVIRAFNKQQHEIDRFGKTNEETAKISGKSVTLASAITPVVNTLFGLTNVAAMVIGAGMVMYGTLEVGSLVSATAYISTILGGIMMAAAVISLFPDAYACMNRIGAVLDAEVSLKESQKEMPNQTCKGTVEFRKVTFSYPGADEPVIKDISFVSKPGETTAIIGRTGCGKSSVVKLIPRLYDTVFGEILVDGVNVKDYKLEDLRKIIGYVPQKNVLFSGDIASNLNFGNENGTEADWQEACRISCSEEFVSKKDGTYHSEVAQGGTNFSGGQRQRLAIARAVMKKPEVYIFDDSFSALDMKTDKTLRANLKESMGDATMIVVAQRVNTIMDATRILVLENGEVVGMGTHLELLKSCKLYREIAEIQLGEEEVANELKSA